MGIKKVLIVYGTRYGATEEVAQEIAKVITQKGYDPLHQCINKWDLKISYSVCC